jgi:hypothetical protein
MLFCEHVMTSFRRLGWVYRQGDAGLGRHFELFKPHTILIISFCIKKLLDFWAVFLV